MLFLKITLRIFTCYFILCIDKEHLASARCRFIGVTNNDASLHRRIVEKVLANSDNTFNQVMLHKLFAHILFFSTEQNAVREQNCASSRAGLQAFQNMLEKCVVSSALRRYAEEITTVLIGFKGISVPRADRVRWVCQYDIKLLKLTSLRKRRIFQSVRIDDLEVQNAVEEQIHFSDGCGKWVDLLTVTLHTAPLGTVLTKVVNTGNQHSRTTAGGIINSFTGLGFQNLCHKVHDGTVRIEFLRGMTAVVTELFNQIFVCLTELVLGAVCNGQCLGAKMLDQVFQHFVGQCRFISPRSVTENTHKDLFVRFRIFIRLFNGIEGVLYGNTNVFGCIAHVFPMIAFRDDKSMNGSTHKFCAVLAVLLDCICGFLIINVTNALEEEQRKYV